MSIQNIKCPACGELIEWDSEAGRAVGHGRPKKSVDLNDALQSLKGQEASRLKMFQRSREEEKNKSDRLDRLFSKEEKRIREEKDYGRYLRDVDLD